MSLDSVALGRLSADAVGGVMLDPLPKGLWEGIPSVSRVFANISLQSNSLLRGNILSGTFQSEASIVDGKWSHLG